MGSRRYTYYHVKKDTLDPRANKAVFLGFKRGVKGYKLWDPKDKKIVVSGDITFDEASMMKPTSFQLVESEQTKDVSQRIENDTTSRILNSLVSFEFSPDVTQGGVM